MKVAVLPTGQTELFGLGKALNRLFPGHHFYCLSNPAEVAAESKRSPFRGFTGNALSDEHRAAPPGAAKDLLERAAQEALGDRRKEAADLVLMVDDLELPNQHQPELVVAVMRRAVEDHLKELPRRAFDRTQSVLRAKVSFHLVVPMIESWFFGDPGALARAGVPPGSPVGFRSETDPEAFETDDSRYLAATEADCPAFAALPAHKKTKKVRPKWLGSSPRERHPKGYLQWLCRAPADSSCTRYSEKESGGPALAEIRWEALLARPAAHFGFLRALIEDLEDGLGCSASLLPAGGEVASLTSRRRDLRQAVLRNI